MFFGGNGTGVHLRMWDLVLTHLLAQGPTPLQPSPLLPALPQRKGKAALARLQRRLRYDLDRRSSRHAADQASRRQYVSSTPPPPSISSLTLSKLFLPVRLHHRLHAIPAGHRFDAQRTARLHDRPNTRLQCSGLVVAGGRREHTGRQRRRQGPGGAGDISALHLLRRAGLFVLHLLAMALVGAVYDGGSLSQALMLFFHSQGFTQLCSLASNELCGWRRHRVLRTFPKITQAVASAH